MKRRQFQSWGWFLFLALLLLILGGALFYYRGGHTGTTVEDKEPRALSLSKKKQTISNAITRAKPEMSAVLPLAPFPLRDLSERSPLADKLNAAENTASDDLKIVRRMLNFYRESFQGYPVAESNRELVNALTGNNPRGVALIERLHPAINIEGELTDRWGSPLFYHMVSRHEVELRAAGLDKELWTDDDIINLR